MPFANKRFREIHGAIHVVLILLGSGSSNSGSNRVGGCFAAAKRAATACTSRAREEEDTVERRAREGQVYWGREHGIISPWIRNHAPFISRHWWSLGRERDTSTALPTDSGLFSTSVKGYVCMYMCVCRYIYISSNVKQSRDLSINRLIPIKLCSGVECADGPIPLHNRLASILTDQAVPRLYCIGVIKR